MVCPSKYSIWLKSHKTFRYCIPMDNDRPSLDLKYFEDICPDKNGTLKGQVMNWD
jgi:hypothetical protein